MYPSNQSSADDPSHVNPGAQDGPEASAESLDETLDRHGDTNADPAHSSLKHPEDWVGRTIARYKILRVLGVGGMGMVFEALDTAIERHVALKILPTELVEEQIARQRFLEEARAVGKLNHPHVVVLHEIGSDADVHYIVMELVRGGTSEDFCQKDTMASILQATKIARQAASGLVAAHNAGIVHRDVKPANLLLDEEGNVKVTDFGLAKQVADPALGMTREGQIIGTPSYISPEQCESRPVDSRTDVYSLGATYYALLTGERPYADQMSVVAVMYAHCNVSVPDPRKKNPAISASAAKVIARAMAKRPINRYAKMADMEAALTDVERELIGSTPLIQPRQRKVWPLIATVVLLFVGLAGAFWMLGRGPVLPTGKPIKVGVLHSLSGTMADSERPVVDATLLAIEKLNEAGGVLGRPVKPIVADGKSRAAAPNQQILPAIDWLFHNKKMHNFFIVGSDYVFPRMAGEVIKDRLRELGGIVSGEVFLPLGTRNVDIAVDAIEKAKPDIILNLINGSTNVAFFEELRSHGIMPDKIPSISFSVGESELSRMDPESMAGDYAAWNYFQSIDSPANHDFVAAFKAKYGPHQVITDPMETAYAGVMLWAAAVTEAGGTEPAAIRRGLRGVRGEGPGGELRIDPATQHAYKKPRIGQIRPDGQFDVVWEAERPLKPEPYPASRPAAAWRAALHDLYRGWGNHWSAPVPAKKKAKK